MTRCRLPDENIAIGQLFDTFDADLIERSLFWINLDQTSERTLALVLHNARRYFGVSRNRHPD